MNQQPDKLFQQKLENYSRPIPANAWNRVEQNLNKKNNKPFWLKIAAGLIILLSASVFLFIRDASRPQLISQRKNTPDHIEKNQDPQPPVTDSIQTPTQKEANKTVTVDRVKQDTLTKKKTRTIKTIQPDVTIAQNIDQTEKPSTIVNVKDETPQAIVAVQEKNQTLEVKKQNRSITIILAAEEVNEKYLDKKSLAEATHEEKKSSTFKKLLDKANDLKHNQDAIGEIRQKKNEILALNFRNDKERIQNR